MSTPLAISGTVDLKIMEQPARTKLEKEIIAAIADSGKSKALIHQCRIALDTKAAFRDYFKGMGFPFTVLSATFGKSSKTGLPYQHVSVRNDESREIIRFQWDGAAIPAKLVEIAVKHDQGRRTRPTVVKLDLDRAAVTSEPAKASAKKSDKDSSPRRAKESAPRIHSRMCQDDLVRVYG